MWYIPEGSISICNVSAWVRTLHECAQRFSGSLMFHIISRHSDVRATVTHVPCRTTQYQPMPQHIENSGCVFVYLWCIERSGSLVISVGSRYRLRADRPGNCRMIPERDRNIYILYLVQNCSGVHPVSDATCAGRGGRGTKRPTREADHSLSTKDIEKNRWLRISASHTYSCMVINWRCTFGQQVSNGIN
jgi:hypothetical protein